MNYKKLFSLKPLRIEIQESIRKKIFLFWRASPWFSKNILNSWISFSFLSSYFYLEGYRICADSSSYPKSFLLEGQTTEGNWIAIDNNKDSLDKSRNSFFIETSFRCQTNEFFQSLRFTNVAPNAQGYNDFQIYSIEFFGSLTHSSPTIMQKTQINPKSFSDALGVLFYLQRKLSSNEYQEKISVSASSSGRPFKNPPENILSIEGHSWYSSSIPNQSITISFQDLELEIESYRFCTKYKYRPFGWKLEGSRYSNEQWTLIDFRGDEFRKEGATDKTAGR